MLLAQARRLACGAARRPAACAAQLAAPPAPPALRRAALLRCRAAAGAPRAASAGADATAPDAPPPATPAGRSAGSATPERAAKQELIDLQPPRGTRDFAPDEMRLRNWLFGHFREARDAQRGCARARTHAHAKHANPACVR
jgi:hypothetical protein